MTAISTKVAAFAIAASALIASPLLTSHASAKPAGPGPIKVGSPIVKGPIFNKGPIFKGPIVKGPIKIVKPNFPLKPICKGPGCFPKPSHHHGHGALWVLGGVTILASAYEGCGYEYYKWKANDSAYWHAKYRECRGWDD